LTSEDKRKMERSCCIRSSITMNFLSLPADSLTVELGTAVWAKLDMVGILPVERVLYLDADILVRADLGELWKTSLRAEDMLAAAIDIGHPEGHDEFTRGGYFNAGVLLLDLAKIRLQITQLLSLARSMKEAKYRDQDALNVYFKDQWTRLDVKWNAQGLGTYANDATESRSQILGLSSAQRNPSIVHFTGPVHPSLERVLNPFVQPYTAKPWGYAGAPGNPYCAEWWACLEQTEWKGMSKSDEYRVGCSEAKRLALGAAAKAFGERLGEFDIPSSC
jgi:lipopolysaccharide biosynthesis glycosyltransferase